VALFPRFGAGTFKFFEKHRIVLKSVDTSKACVQTKKPLITEAFLYSLPN
jgi:hypothetical protein